MKKDREKNKNTATLQMPLSLGQSVKRVHSMLARIRSIWLFWTIKLSEEP